MAQANGWNDQDANAEHDASNKLFNNRSSFEVAGGNCASSGHYQILTEDGGGGSLWNNASLGRHEGSLLSEQLNGEGESDSGLSVKAGDKTRRRKVAILSVDGGGMRGVIPARVLGHIEKMIVEKTGNADARIADYFDMAAGTSVGALLTVMLFARGPTERPLFRATETWDFMRYNADQIFFSPWWTHFYTALRGIFYPKYSAKHLEKVLQNHLSRNGERLTLRDCLKPILLPCYDLSRASVFLFTSKAAHESESWNFYLWEILRACSAAPGLFRPYKLWSMNREKSVTAIDGALVMNNPAAAAVTHVINTKEEFPDCRGPRDILLLSLGTGMFAQTYEHKEVKKWGAARWTRPVLKIIVDGIADAVDRTVSLAFPKDVKNQYLRLQAVGLPKKAWDESSDPSPANVERLTQIADELLDAKCRTYEPFGHMKELKETNRERLSAFVDALIQEHEKRKLDEKAG